MNYLKKVIVQMGSVSTLGNQNMHAKFLMGRTASRGGCRLVPKSSQSIVFG